MLHLWVEDADAWWRRLDAADLAGRYGARVGVPEDRPLGHARLQPARSGRGAVADRPRLAAVSEEPASMPRRCRRCCGVRLHGGMRPVSP